MYEGVEKRSYSVDSLQQLGGECLECLTDDGAFYQNDLRHVDQESLKIMYHQVFVC